MASVRIGTESTILRKVERYARTRKEASIGSPEACFNASAAWKGEYSPPSLMTRSTSGPICSMICVTESGMLEPRSRM